MEIIFHKRFLKGYENLLPKQQDKIEQIIAIFRQNPCNPCLNNHALHGDRKGRRAISAGGDLRLIFRENNNYEKVVFLLVGTHNQVY